VWFDLCFKVCFLTTRWRQRSIKLYLYTMYLHCWGQIWPICNEETKTENSSMTSFYKDRHRNRPIENNCRESLSCWNLEENKKVKTWSKDHQPVWINGKLFSVHSSNKLLQRESFLIFLSSLNIGLLWCSNEKWK